ANEWDEIEGMVWWREIIHVLLTGSTFLTRHSMTVGASSNDLATDDFLEKAVGTNGGEMLAAINQLAAGVNASIEFAPDGSARLARNIVFLTDAERDLRETVADFDERDWIDYTLFIDHSQPVGRVEADGGWYKQASNKVKPLLSVAPGVAQASGSETRPLSGQILKADQSKSDAQNELNKRAGNAYDDFNNPYELKVVHPDGYHWIVPSRYQWYTFTIPANSNTAGRAFTTSDRWYCTNVLISHD
ncbi:MAG: hypothetical protein CUN54_09300, partial [Phototrophicales bacterium]